MKCKFSLVRLGIRRVKLEVEDDRGNKYTFSITSPISREKLAQFVELVEIMSGPSGEKPPSMFSSVKSKFEKVFEVIRERFPLSWFSSADVQLAYEEKFKEPISLSTVSTYLSRYCDRGLLIRQGPPNMLKYRLNLSEVVEGST